MTDEITAVSANANWVVTAGLALWGVVLRVGIGRHYSAVDKINERLDNLQETQVLAAVELAKIKGYLEAMKR